MKQKLPLKKSLLTAGLSLMLVSGAGSVYGFEGAAGNANLSTYPTSSEAMQAQEETISGVVKDANGAPLMGVSVALQGTTRGVSTDRNGKFSLNIPATGGTLVISYVGMKSQEIKLTPMKDGQVRAAMDIVLEEEELAAEEVVVNGFAGASKSSFTGAHKTINRDEILKVSTTNLFAAMQVFDPSIRIPVNVEMGSDPNQVPEMYMRGRSGIETVKELDKVTESSSSYALATNPNLPLFILDGFEVDATKINDLDIYRVKSMTILKDAAATALYGSRASNGVITIETMAPGAGKLSVNYNATFKVTAPDLSSYNLCNAAEMLEVERRSGLFELWYEDETYTKIFSREKVYHMKKNQILQGVDTYWLSQPLETMFNQTHSLSVEGGVDDVRIGLDARYSNENGVMKESKRNNMSAGVTVDYRTKKLQIKNNASVGIVKSQNSPYGNFSTYTGLKPYYELYDKLTGEIVKEYQWIDGGTPERNPIWNVVNTKNYDRSEYVEFANNLALNYFFTDRIYIKGTFSVSRKIEDGEVFKDPKDSSFGTNELNNSGLFEKGSLNTSTRTTDRWNAKFYGVFNKTWNEDHSLMSSAGFDINGNSARYETTTYKGFPNGDRTSPGWAKEQTNRTYTDSKTHLFGGFLTANYTYKDTYMADVSVRMDGSSEFGTDKKWGIFWSAGAGVNLHKMDFMSDYENVDILKIRANVGRTGKTGFQPYAAENIYNIDTNDWYMTGIGATLKYLGNPNLSWESATTYNVGIDLTMFQNRFDISLDYYHKLTEDMVTEMALPTSSGFSKYTENIGEVVNKGFEIDMSVNVIRTKDVSLDLGFNLAHNDNKLTKVSNALARYNERIDEYYKQEKNTYNSGSINGGTANFNNFSSYLNENVAYTKPYMKYEEGQSLTGITAMPSWGINPADGQEIFIRPDGSLTTIWSPDEQTRVGDTEPKASGSFRVSARYKQWSLFTTFLYEFGGDAYNNTLVTAVENVDILKKNVDRRVLTDRWYTPGQDARFKSINARAVVTKPTSRMVQKNNYVKFNSLQLSYEFDRNKLRNIGLRQLKLSLSMQDIAQWSTVKREMGTSYPFARSFSLVLNTSF